MPRTTIYSAKTEKLEILSPDGSVDTGLLPPLTKEEVLGLYRDMLTIRAFDDKALKLQRQGRMGTWASTLGQEAAQAALARNLTREDWLAPTFRESGLMLIFGVPAVNQYVFWKGDEAGALYPDGVNCLPPSVPIASQFLHAAGIGMALKKKGAKGVAVGFGGDGSTSEGDFHEALNFAGVFGARTLFYVQNNQWAISVPFKRQTAAESVAQKAHAYGIPGIQVDGNDIFAVHAATKAALDHIRAGKGAYLVEALTYRMQNHTTADDHTRYRTPEETAFWAEREPVRRMRLYLEKKKWWDDKKEAALQEELAATVEGWVTELESRPAPKPESMVAHMYKEMPWYLKEQYEFLKAEVRG
jgi:pyruvate dehydrogenase E1 component alpha subunit